MTEIWKDIKGYEGYYQVSNKGRVISLTRKTTNGRTVNTKILKAYEGNHGYLCLDLYKNNLKRQFAVHRLVAEAFISNPKNKPQVNHKKGNKLDNYADKLEWATVKENIYHAFNVLGRTVAVGEKNGRSKLTEKQVLEIRGSKLTTRVLGKIYNIDQKQISNIKNKKSWKHVDIEESS
jgi:hypothetical protein